MSGIKRMRDVCAGNGNKISFDFTDAFWVEIKSNNISDKATPITTPMSTPMSTRDKLLLLIEQNPKITRKELALNLGVSINAVKNHLLKLKKTNILQRVGNNRTGYWKFIKNE